MSVTTYADGQAIVVNDDCKPTLATLEENSIDSIVTDPPYELKFMGKKWDGTGIAYDVEMWEECLRVLKPGGHLLAFGGSRTWHRMAAAIEDAGFELRDSIAWLYGSGFPKSLDVSKAIDKAAGADREVVGDRGAEKCRYLARGEECPGHDDPGQNAVFNPTVHRLPTSPATPEAERWQGWGTALKPAFEPIVVARKTLAGTVAANVLEHGTGALNIDACRIEGEPWKGRLAPGLGSVKFFFEGDRPVIDKHPHSSGRWPTNVVLDESQAAELGDSAKFFPVFKYQAKAPSKERPRVDGVAHPTVKPLALMRWLVRLVTPPGGWVLDPFAGSGTTGEAAYLEGFRCLLIEREADYLPLIEHRLNRVSGKAKERVTDD